MLKFVKIHGHIVSKAEQLNANEADRPYLKCILRTWQSDRKIQTKDYVDHRIRFWGGMAEEAMKELNLNDRIIAGGFLVERNFKGHMIPLIMVSDYEQTTRPHRYKASFFGLLTTPNLSSSLDEQFELEAVVGNNPGNKLTEEMFILRFEDAQFHHIHKLNYGTKIRAKGKLRYSSYHEIPFPDLTVNSLKTEDLQIINC